MVPQAAYIHVPFCARRCGYCNFTVVAGRDDLIDAYLTALERELSGLERPRPVETLFVGGGTPTHLSPQQLERLMHVVRRWFPLAKGGEFSVEANPADADRATVDVLAESGVNRLSLGVQSFDENKLSVLERDHRADRVEQACELARRVVSDLSLDLIFAVPGETLDTWQRDLALALRQTPNHVSTYGLTFDRGARFLGRLRRGDLSEIDEETQRAMYETAIDTLVNAGFEHYEVSNFARPGHRCRHNEIYWSGREYYAAGPGAARYVAGVREQNHGSTFTYLKRVLRGDSPVVASEKLSPEDAARERLVFGLRMLQGIECDAFERDTGFDVGQLGGQELSRYLEMGFLEKDGQRLRLTRDGLMISDSLWPGLLRV